MTICEGYHELLVRLANPEDSITHNDVTYFLAVGEGDTSPQYGNLQLNNEHDRTDITDYLVDGTELLMSVFLDSTEANPPTGQSTITLVEAGVVATIDGEPTEYLLNHSLIDDIQKDAQTTATVEMRLELLNDPSDP